MQKPRKKRSSIGFDEAIHIRIGELGAAQQFYYMGDKYEILIEGKYHNTNKTTGNVQVIKPDELRANCRLSTLPRRFFIPKKDVIR